MNIHSEAASSLALAMVASSSAPLLLLDGELCIIAASTSFTHLFQLAPQSVTGQKLTALGDGEWAVPQLGSLLRATGGGHAAVEAYEMDLCRKGAQSRRLVINAQKLDYGDIGNVRLLVAVLDVTEARIAEKLKDDLLREKAILLRELQHRVANSLQIIASVLMQNARTVQSEETRGHLYEAHNRVMSVAAMQAHLAPSRIGEVKLRGYLTALCESIGASMIRDHDQISLDVSSDDSVTIADVSVSLGLIVTELVINALKHAFPGHRKGRIAVDYRSSGTSWTMSVSDDGVGMPKVPTDAGLGTTIVESLAKQLDATVATIDRKSGTSVSIIHL